MIHRSSLLPHHIVSCFTRSNIISTKMVQNTQTMISLYDCVPDEVTRIIFGYADIPSMMALCVCSSRLLTFLSNDENNGDGGHWGSIVKRRFGISTSRGLKSRKTKKYGCRSWKEVYRSLSLCNRMPKVAYSTGGFGGGRRIVFAQARNNGVGGDGVGIWVMLEHTENCHTRLLSSPMEEDRSGCHLLVPPVPVQGCPVVRRRLIKIRLVVQNITSGFSMLSFDPCCIDLCWVDVTGHRRIVGTVTTGPMRPRINGRRSGSQGGNCRRRDDSNDDGGIITNGDGTVSLLPLRHVILSVYFPCDSDVVFETDFLSRAVSVNVPVRWGDDEVGDIGNRGDIEDLTRRRVQCASASFIPECKVWEHYNLLPGNNLTIVDRFPHNSEPGL